MRAHLPTLLTLLVGLVACNQRNPNEIPGGVVDQAVPNWSVETFATPLELGAGETIEVTCVVRDGNILLAGVPIDVEISPAAEQLELVGNVATFRMTSAVVHDVNCRTRDFDIVDPVGVSVSVNPAAGVRVDTLSQASSAQAGAPVEVSCIVYDEYTNPVPDESADGLLADESIRIDETVVDSYLVRGTSVGTFEVACRLGEVVDATPLSLSIEAGAARDSETTVVPSTLRPNQTAIVSCDVFDDFGNPLSGFNSGFYAIDETGTPVELESDSVFSADRAGQYLVFCNVPGAAAADESPVEVTVLPGKAVSMIEDFVEQDCYFQNRPLPFAYRLFDEFGNIIDPYDSDLDIELVVDSDPAGSVVVTDSGQLLVAGEGVITFSVTPSGSDVAPGFSDSYTQSITVDSTPPTIGLTSPSRASRRFSSSSSYTIFGTASDGISDLVSLSVNNELIDVSGQQLSVNYTLPNQISRWGINVITGEAEDSCGNRAVLASSFARSSQFFSPSTTANVSARASDAVVAHLNQSILDDGNRNDIDDIATLAQGLVQDQDFNDLVPPGQDFFFDDCGSGRAGYVLIERDPNTSRLINWDGPWIFDVSAVNGGIRFALRVDDFDFPIHLRARTCPNILGINETGFAGASRIDVSGVLELNASGGNVTAALDSSTTELDVSGLYFDPDCPNWIDWLCDGAFNLVLPLFTGLIENALEDVLADQIPGLLEDFMESFALDQGFSIPPPLDMDLKIGSGIENITFCGPQVGGESVAPGCDGFEPPGLGYGQLGLAAQIFPSERGDDIPSFYGAIRDNSVPPAFSSTDYAFGLGLSDDLLNQVMWALWYGGGLDLSVDDILEVVGSEIDLSGIEISLQAESPPVVMTGNFGNDPFDGIKVGLGDAYIEASVDIGALLGDTSQNGFVIHAGMYLSALLNGGLGFDSETNTLSVGFGEDPEIHVQVVTIDDVAYQAVLSELFENILSYVVPRLLDQALASFPIPEFDLTNLTGVSVGGESAVWSLQNGDIEREQSCFTINGEPYCWYGDFHTLTGDLY